jgi:hypothetical protein
MSELEGLRALRGDTLVAVAGVREIQARVSLTYRYQGRQFRLTDVHGHVVKGVLA